MNARILGAFGQNLNRLRMAAGLTQEKLAEKAEVSLRYIQFLEAGQRNPSIATLVSLHKVMGCSYDELFRNL